MNERKKLLLISYYFPPIGMGGVQRASKLAKYLSRTGWDVTVLTVKDIIYYKKDNSLLDDLQDINIIRTGSLDPSRILYKLSAGRSKTNTGNVSSNKGRLSSLFRFVERYLFIPDSKKFWTPFVLSRVKKLNRINKFDIILSTAPPFSTHIAAYYISKSLKIPWAADFRDGWTNNDFLKKRKFIYLYINRILEKMVIKKSDGVFGISEKIIDHLKQLDIKNRNKFSIIYNGFDEEDFEKTEDSEDKFTVSFMGAVTQWSDPSVFIPVLKSALQKDPDLKHNMKIKIIGEILYPVTIKAFEKEGLSDNLVIKGYLPHKSAVKDILRSSILLFPITKYDTTGIVPGKMYEYLASGLPMLVHLPKGEAEKIINKYAKKSVYYSKTNSEECADFIIAEFKKWGEKGRSNEKDIRIYDPELDKFSRKKQAERISGILESILKNREKHVN
ncbi:glycosyltransferase family 4 protein [candidate division KSB1 bacterium]